MSLYGLTRDDGVRLLVPANAWESALELAYLYGWRPAGTQSPRATAPAGTNSDAAQAWDAQDYFTPLRQRVQSDDARSLARALDRALRGFGEDDPKAQASQTPQRASPMASRSAARQAGLNPTQRRAMDRFAAFAQCGGFTIQGAP